MATVDAYCILKTPERETNTMSNRIEPLDRLGLIKHDPSASPSAPMEVYLKLHTETGELHIEWQHQSDNMISMRTYHGFDRQYTINHLANGHLLTERINAGEIDDMLHRIHTGTKTVWNGCDHVVRLSIDAEIAEECLQDWLDNAEVLNGDAPGYWLAADWLAGISPADENITTDTTDTELDHIAARLTAEAAAMDAVVVNIRETLEEWRKKLQKKETC